jgi:FKBP-type peptidyl-prolyl cis-trans isomerase
VEHITAVLRISAVSLTAAAFGCTSPTPEPAGPAAGADELYTLGAAVGRGFVSLGLDEAEAERLARGFADAALERAPEPTPEALVRAKEYTRERVLAQSRLEEQAGVAVLEEAARAEGAERRESGLVVRVIEPGDGPPPEPMQYVTLDYRGTLRDGRVFLTTEATGPRTMRLGTTIRCWQEALAEVGAGAKLELVCPPALGHGAQGLGEVPGGAVLRFELELHAVSDEAQH